MIEESLPGGVKIAVTTRHQAGARGQWGFNLATHVNDDPLAVASNRALLKDKLASTYTPVWLDQYHSSEVVAVERAPAEPIRADGAYTQVEGLPLAVLTADCLPIVLWNDVEIAVVHAGWRGLAGGIIAAGVKRFEQRPQAWIGPGIGPSYYEVDDAVASQFQDRSVFRETRAGHYAFDLAGEALRQLEVLNVTGTNSGLCTASDGRFYSHRAEGPTGRFATIVWR